MQKVINLGMVAISVAVMCGLMYFNIWAAYQFGIDTLGFVYGVLVSAVGGYITYIIPFYRSKRMGVALVLAGLLLIGYSAQIRYFPPERPRICTRIDADGNRVEVKCLIQGPPTSRQLSQGN